MTVQTFTCAVIWLAGTAYLTYKRNAGRGSPTATIAAPVANK
ncbi:MAG TPA: hypothetical protein VF233_07650 [Nitrososphaeraceae archaeon]